MGKAHKRLGLLMKLMRPRKKLSRKRYMGFALRKHSSKKHKLFKIEGSVMHSQRGNERNKTQAVHFKIGKGSS